MPDFRTIIESTNSQERTPSVEETHSRLIWGLEGLGVFGLSGEPFTKAPDLSPPGAHSKDEFSNCIVCTRSRSTPASTAAVEACNPSKVSCIARLDLLLE